jgi:hypothetical protein
MRRFALQAQAVSGLISLPELTSTPSTALSRSGRLLPFNLRCAALSQWGGKYH